MNDLWLISPIAWATTDDADALRRQLREAQQRIAALEAKLYEARNAVRLAASVIHNHAPHIKPVYLTDMIAKWDKG